MSTVNGEVGHLVGQLLQVVCDHTFVDERCKNAVQTEVELVVLGKKSMCQSNLSTFSRILALDFDRISQHLRY